MRGLQVVEHACSLTFLQMGSTLPGIAKDIDCTSYRVPIGKLNFLKAYLQL